MKIAGALCLGIAGALCLGIAGALCLRDDGALCLRDDGALCLRDDGALCLRDDGALRMGSTMFLLEKHLESIDLCALLRTKEDVFFCLKSFSDLLQCTSGDVIYLEDIEFDNQMVFV
jgi:hypothetical protein